MFETLATEGVNIEMISTSTIRISCVVHEDDVEQAVRALHAAFELEAHRDRRSVVDGVRGRRRRRHRPRRHRDAPPPRERGFPVDELRAYASPRSEGRKLPFADGEVVCEVLRDGCFDGLDLVVIDVDDPLALEWAPRAAAAGARVVDKSAAFRMDPDVPLVIAEINPDDLRDMPQGIVSSPQLHHHGAAGCAGAAAPCGRHPSAWSCPPTSRSRAPGNPGCASSTSSGRRAPARPSATSTRAHAGPLDAGEVWDRPIAGNVIPLAGSVKEAGYTSEEWKMVRESRKILHAPDIQVTCTCVRVPVYVGHGVSVNVQFEQPLTARRRGRAPRRTRRVCSSSTAATGTPRRWTRPVSTRCSSVGCARTRRRTNTLDLWVTGDNLRKGAALNGIQLLGAARCGLSTRGSRRRAARRTPYIDTRRATSVTRNTCPIRASKVTITRPASVAGERSP